MNEEIKNRIQGEIDKGPDCPVYEGQSHLSPMRIFRHHSRRSVPHGRGLSRC